MNYFQRPLVNSRESHELRRTPLSLPAVPAVLLTLLAATNFLPAGSQAQDRPAATRPVAPVTQPGTQPLPAFMRERSGKRNTSDIRWQEAMWTFYAMLENMEAKQPTSARTMLENIVGLDPDAAQKLTTHAMQTTQDERAYMLELMNQQCSKMPQGAPPNETFATILNDVNTASSAHRDRFVSALFTLIDPLSQQKLRSWVDVNVRSGINIIETDYSMLVQQPNFNAQGMWTRMCAPERAARK